MPEGCDVTTPYPPPVFITACLFLNTAPIVKSCPVSAGLFSSQVGPDPSQRPVHPANHPSGVRQRLQPHGMVLVDADCTGLLPGFAAETDRLDVDKPSETLELDREVDGPSKL